jgi:hypothetical protein
MKPVKIAMLATCILASGTVGLLVGGRSALPRGLSLSRASDGVLDLYVLCEPGSGKFRIHRGAQTITFIASRDCGAPDPAIGALFPPK